MNKIKAHVFYVPTIKQIYITNRFEDLTEGDIYQFSFNGVITEEKLTCSNHSLYPVVGDVVALCYKEVNVKILNYE